MKVDINLSLVSQLVATQFPQWADLPIKPVEFDGWDNRTFRLGEEMTVRLPSAERYTPQVAKEHLWLPRLALLLPLPIPAPLAMGVPADGYPWHWSVYRWIEGRNTTTERIADPNQFAITLAQFLVALQRIDPACDLTIAWTLFSGESREAFRAVLPVDGATWARGRGWALWKGLITLVEHINTNPSEAGKSRRVIDEVLVDHKHPT